MLGPEACHLGAYAGPQHAGDGQRRRLAYTQLVLQSKKQAELRFANLKPNDAPPPPSIVVCGSRVPKQSDATTVDGSDGPIPLSQEHFGLDVSAIPLNAQDRSANAR